MATRESSLALAIAELINRLSPDEQAELAAHLSLEQIQSLESIKRATITTWREPEIYVEIGPDEISFETPPDRVLPFLLQLWDLLQPQKVEVRITFSGESMVLHGRRHYQSQLDSLATVLDDEPVVIEFDQHTLYSNGGGCMMLKTSADSALKRRIAQEFLNICDVDLQVDRDRFIALVENGHVEVLG
jgi:hypothetical protein